MNKWRDLTIPETATIRDALETIDDCGQQVALVINPDGSLIGTVTDGDIRRGILAGVDLSSPVSGIMNRKPKALPLHTSHEEVLQTMRRLVLRQMPLVDEAGRLVGFLTLNELLGSIEKPNTVVLMAGGLGSRLRPLTESKPKPLLPVGGRPILETIIEGLAEQGFRKVFICVNYKGAMIKEYFGDGSRWGSRIEYVTEEKSLGTAGALSLVPGEFKDPLIVMNADLLTKANFDSLLHFHQEQGSVATMTVREYDFEVPFGVVSLDGADIIDIEEKPVHRFFVNAGIYALSPDCLSLIPRDTYYDMPMLFKQLIQAGQLTRAYHLREYWLDIGRVDELERAQQEWATQN